MFPNTPQRLLTTLAGLAIVSIAILLGLDSRRDYALGVAVLEENLQAKTKLLAEHAELSLAGADLVLGEIEERLRHNGLADFERDRRYWESVRRRLAHTPQLAHIAIVDAHGRVRFASTHFPVPRADLGDREYFEAHRSGQEHYIARPTTIARDDGRHIPVSIRLGGPGRFEGVLLATLDVAYFEAFYQGVRDKLNLRIGMFRRDGALLSLYPVPADADLASVAAAESSVAAALAGDHVRTWIDESPISGVRKILSYRHLQRYPVAVAVAYDYRAFMQGLYPNLIRNLIVFVVFAIGILLSTSIISRQISRAERTRETQEATERLCHAIIQHLPDGRIAVFDRERRYLFADGQLFSGHSTLASDKIVGKTMPEIHPPERLPVIEGLAARALAGEQTEVEIPLDGRVYRLVASPLKYDAEEAVEQCMLFTQDITASKEIQRALEALSTTDALLGIANRRGFEERLDEEVRRAAREGSPLALLLIDVDCFKIYNDCYGHQAGDACLRKVAQALSEAVARPGDLVARYGGEEFAVLLPRSNRAGALRIAERIHQLFAKHAIPFPASPVIDRISVSIGVAADVHSSQLSPATLIAASDAGLYAAKHAGRNRTACANKLGQIETQEAT